MADSRVTLPAFSMFSRTPVYEVNGIILFGLMMDPVIASSTDQIYVMPQAEESRLDLISALFYGTPQLWWIIALVNNITDPIVGAPPGTALRIPTKDRLSQEGILSG